MSPVDEWKLVSRLRLIDQIPKQSSIDRTVHVALPGWREVEWKKFRCQLGKGYKTPGRVYMNDNITRVRVPSCFVVHHYDEKVAVGKTSAGVAVKREKEKKPKKRCKQGLDLALDINFLERRTSRAFK